MTIPYSVRKFGIKSQLLDLGVKIKKSKKIYYIFKDINGNQLLLKSNVIYCLAYIIYITVQNEYPT